MSRSFLALVLTVVVTVPLVLLGWARFAPVESDYTSEPAMVGVWESRLFEYRQPAWEEFATCRLLVLSPDQIPAAGIPVRSEDALTARLLLGNTLQWSPETTGTYHDHVLKLRNVALKAEFDAGGMLLLTAPDGRQIRMQKVASGDPARRLWEKSMGNRLPAASPVGEQ